MALSDLFKRVRYVSVPPASRTAEPSPSLPPETSAEEGKVNCPACRTRIEKTAYDTTGKVCPHCGHTARLTSAERLSITVDEGSFEELFQEVVSADPLGFEGYPEKVARLQERTGLGEAVVTARASVGGNPCLVGVMDSRFMMSSMGSAVGEKLTRLFELGAEQRLPVIIFTASGGARMQEGILSLMQMAKVSGAVGLHSKMGGLYVTVLTDPTTGGVTASFAMLGDIILAEPGALIGFAGRRVIEGTIRHKLPSGFQSAEFQREHGFVDRIVPRPELRDTIATLLKLHSPNKQPGKEADGHG